MKNLSIWITILLLLMSSQGHTAVEGYSYSASRFVPKQEATATVDAIPYESIKHHTRHKKYHSALQISRTVSSVTIAFHTKEALTKLRGRHVNGFSKVRRDGSCEIHVMMPYNWNDDDAMRTVGHELMHCFGARHEQGKQKQKRTSRATLALNRVAQQPVAAPGPHHLLPVVTHNTVLSQHYKSPVLLEKRRNGLEHF